MIATFAVLTQQGEKLGEVRAEQTVDASFEAVRQFPDHARTLRLVRLTPRLANGGRAA